MSVAVPLKAPDANGFPQADEALQLAELEDALAKRLEADREAVYVLAISTNGMREFVFYANDPEEALERLRVVELGNPSHELQFAIEPDPKWTTYKRFA